jgi:hypothetical protein
MKHFDTVPIRQGQAENPGDGVVGTIGCSSFR